jgi:dihydroorotate dehydrogenase (NAD+) catalytic subunit
VYKSVKIPVFGIGGIATWEDAVEFFLVGASAVQVGTQNFVNPATAVEIVKGVAEYCTHRSIDDISQLVGSLNADANVSVIQSWL